MRIPAGACLLLALAGCGEPPRDVLRLADPWLEQHPSTPDALRSITIDGVTRLAIPIEVGREERVRVTVPRDAVLEAWTAAGPREDGDETPADAVLELAACGDAAGSPAPRRALAGVEVRASAWTPLRVGMEGLAGETLTLCLSARPADAAAPAGAAVVWLANATLGPPDARRWPPGRPNLLLITLDTARGHPRSSAGSPRATTPNLDRLAAAGEQYPNAVANSPLALPIHASLFTGLHPREHGADRPTLAEQIWALGYRTGAVVAGPMLGAESGLAQGFDAYDPPAGPSGSPERLGARTADEVTDRALAWLGRDPRPWFLFLSYFDAERGARIDRSDAEILAVDRAIGRLLDALRARDDWSSTLVAVVSVDGDPLGEHRRPDHRGSLGEDRLRAALIVRYPEGPGAPRVGRRLEQRVDLLDLHATLLRELGLLPGAEGRPSKQRPAERFASYGLHAERRVHFAEVRRDPRLVAAYGSRIDRDLEAVYQGRWKLIRDDRGRSRLFDLESDPREQQDLAAREPERAARLARLLDGWERATSAADADGPPPKLPPDPIERLRALGYLEDAPGD